MPKHHSIEEAVFDISFDSISTEHEQQNMLADFLKNRLLPLADEIFNELSTEGMVSKIDKLEIDLGEINYSNFHNEMEGRFKEQLRTVLQEKILSFATNHSTTEGLISQKQEQENQLELFLETGRMSRSALQSSQLDLDEILHLRIKHEGKYFLEFLKKTNHLDAVLKRLHKQFSQPSLIQTMQLIAPNKALVFEKLLEGYWKISQDKFKDISELEFKLLIREQLMYQLLKSDFAWLEPQEIFAKSFNAVLSKHVPDVFNAERRLDMLATENLSNLALLRTRLEAALIEGKSNSVVDIWDMSLSQHSSLLREIFMQRMGDVIAQRKLVENFPEAMLLDLINVIMPNQAQFISALAIQAELSLTAEGKNTQYWQHTIAFLHALRNHEYKRLDHLASLISHMTQHGLVQAELLKAISRISPEIDKTTLLERVLVKELTAAEDEYTQSNILAAPISIDSKQGTLSRLGQNSKSGTSTGSSHASDEANSVFDVSHVEIQGPPEIKVSSSNIEANDLVPSEEIHNAEHLAVASSLAAVALLRTRLEAALIEGKSNSVVDIWDMSLSQHSSLLREIFMQRMGDVIAQRKLVENFPEAMLLDLINVIMPNQAQFISALAIQAELSLTAEGKNTQYWQHTIAFLHALGNHEYKRLDHLASLISHMTQHGLVQAELLKAISRISPEIDKASLLEHVRKESSGLDQSIKLSTVHEEVLYQRLIQHLKNASQEISIAQEIEELADFYPKILLRFYQQLQTGDVSANYSALKVREIKQLIISFIRLQQASSIDWEAFFPMGSFGDWAQSLKNSIRQQATPYGAELINTLSGIEADSISSRVSSTEITSSPDSGHVFTANSLSITSTFDGTHSPDEFSAHAMQSLSEQHYYLSVLKRLLNNQSANFKKSQPEIEEDSSNLITTREQALASESVLENSALAQTWLLRLRVEEAMVLGQLDKISAEWDELMLNHGAMVRDVFMSRMDDESVREKLAQGFPELYLQDLIRVLMVSDYQFVTQLAKQLALVLNADAVQGNNVGSTFFPFSKHDLAIEQKSAEILRNKNNVPFWKYTFAYLHAIALGRYERNDYQRGILAYLAAQGLSQIPLLIAISCVDSTTHNPPYEISYQHPHRDNAKDNAGLPPSMNVAQRGDELLRRLTQRLSGAGQEQLDITAIAIEYPEIMQGFIKSLQAGNIQSRLDKLSAQESKQLISLLISQQVNVAQVLDGQAANSSNAFQAAIDMQAHKANDKKMFYRFVLDKLIQNQIVDLELAVAVAASYTTFEPTVQNIATSVAGSSSNAALLAAQSTARAQASETDLPHSSKLLRERFEVAFVQGRVDGIVWDELVAHHADMIREVFLSQMGQANVRNEFLMNFPTAMLHELISVLIPFECEYIETLSKQAELTRKAAATVNPIYFLYWEYTLAYLHASGLTGYERTKYTRGLQRLFSAPGFTPSAMANALQRTDTILKETAANRVIMREKEYLSDARLYSTPEANRAAELYQQIFDRLTGKDRIQECAQEITELANSDFEAVAQLYGKLQTGELRLDVTALTLREARQHIETFISVNHGDLGGDFWREIEAHAAKARNPHRYYQYILNRLLANQIVDLEEAMGINSQANHEPDEHINDAEPGHEKLLGSLLESVLHQGNSDILSGLWNELKNNHCELVCDFFKRNIVNRSAINQLIESFSEAIVLDSIKLLKPQESNFLATLASMPELCVKGEAKNESLWRYTLAYLHAQDLSSFDRQEYLRGLIAYLAPHQVTQRSLSRALVQRNPELGSLLSETLKNDTSWISGEAFAADGLAAKILAKHTSTNVGQDASLSSEQITLPRPETALSVNDLQDSASPNSELDARGNIGKVISTDSIRQQGNSYRDELSSEQFGINQDSEPSVGANPAREVTGQFHTGNAVGEKQAAASRHETARSEQLYTRLMRRLDGINNGSSSFASDIEALAREFPIRFKQLIQQLRSAHIYKALSQLSLQEARQFLVFIVGLNGDGASNFLQSIEDYAQQAHDMKGFYLHVLERVINEQVVDLEVALQAQGESILSHEEGSLATESPNIAQAYDQVLPAQAKLQAATFEKALLAGSPNELSGIWLELIREHSAILRDVFIRRAGDTGIMDNLSNGFPETMLRELLGVLIPRDSEYIEALLQQAELLLSTSGKRVNLWKHVLSYLHTCELKEFDKSAYMRSLIAYLSAQAVSRSELLQFSSASTPELIQTLTQHSEAVAHGTNDIQSATSDARDAVLYQHVLNRLTGNAQREAITQIEELFSAYPARLQHLYEQLQSAEIRADISVLSVREAKLLSRSFIELSQGPSAADFLLSIESNAQKADNQRPYYQYILEKLLQKQNVDMEEALRQVSAASTTPDVLAKVDTPGSSTPAPAQSQRESELNANPNLSSAEFDELEETGEEIYIANAGLVLVSPYLPKLFEMLKLTEDSKFIDEKSAERAIHLLQYVVNERCDSPEFLLVLNKLLCGVISKIPITREIVPQPHEKEAIEGMLKGVIGNWSALGNTSVAGLRESFLQRAGRLQLKNDNWYLKVESKAFDMLLDRLPWSIAIIKYSWMKRAIYVEWR